MTKPTKAVSKEIIVICCSIIFTIIVTVLSTISGAGFDINRINSVDVITNITLNATIVLIGTVAAIPYGKVVTMCKKTPEGNPGRYLTDYANYMIAYDKAKNRLRDFNQWHDFKHKQEVHEKQIRFLSEKGILQAEDILKLDRSQIARLDSPQKYIVNGKELYFNSLTKAQIKVCIKVLDGKVTLHRLSDYYFLYVDGKSSESFYEQAYYESAVEHLYLVGKVLSKVMFTFVIACVWTGLILDTIVFDNTTLMKIFINLFARLFTVINSVYSGYTIGQGYIYKKCYYINGKTQFLNEFNNDTTFVYKDIQELAKEEYLNERREDSATDDQKPNYILE